MLTAAPTAGRLENRIWYSRNGQSWTLSRLPYRVDTFGRAVHIAHPWSGQVDGEYRRVQQRAGASAVWDVDEKDP